MSSKKYPLKNLLDTCFSYKNNKVTKKLIYDNKFLDKMGSNSLKLLLILIPFLLYAIMFNPISFDYLGIATAIVFYIVSLVMAMQVILFFIYKNNQKAIKLIEPSWKEYFEDVDFRLLLSSRTTPYVAFKNYYEEALNEKLEDEALYERLRQNFSQMQEENRDLLDAINRDSKR